MGEVDWRFMEGLRVGWGSGRRCLKNDKTKNGTPGGYEDERCAPAHPSSYQIMNNPIDDLS